MIKLSKAYVTNSPDVEILLGVSLRVICDQQKLTLR